jgi:AsmA protein
MKTLFKIVAALVGIVVLLVVVAVVAVPMFFDPNDYRDEIVAKVKDATGRDLKIEGEIGLSVFPWIGADVGVVEFGNAAGFSDPYFARVERVNVRVKLLPLLKKQVEMDTVTVHGLALNLAKDAQGKTNWDDLAKGGAEEAPGKPEPGTGTQLASLAIGGLDVKNAQLRWTDAQAGQSLSIDRLDIQTGALSPGRPVDLKLEADLSGDQIPGGKAKVSLTGLVTADPASGAFKVEDLRLAALDLEARGRLEGSRDAVSGSLAVSEFNPRKLLEALGQSAPVTADPSVLTRLALSTTLSGSPVAMMLDPIDVTLDDTKLAGNVAVGSFDAKLPSVKFALVVDAIDADRYLPPASQEGGTPTAASPGAAATQGARLPVETLRALDVDGSLKVGRLKLANLTTTDVVVTLKAKDGLVNLSPLAAKLYGGTYAGNVALDARRDQPRLSVDEKLAGVQAGPLLKDLTGANKIDGTANVSAKLTAVGADVDAIKKTLNGDAAVAFTDGAVNGINVARTIREFKAKLKGRTLEPAQGELKTDFSEITGTFLVKDGVVTNQDLQAKSPLLRIDGTGMVNLPADNIDYRPTVTVVGTTRGQGGDELKDLIGVPIPLKISGPLASPSYGVDFEKAVAVVAQSQAKDLVKGQLGIITGGATGGAAGALGAGAIGGLLGGSSEGGSDSGATTDSGSTSGSSGASEGVDEAIGGAMKGLKGLFGN